MVSESRMALMFSGCGTHFAATPAVFPEGVQTETVQQSGSCEIVTSSFMMLTEPRSLGFGVDPFWTKQVFPLRRWFLPPAVSPHL